MNPVLLISKRKMYIEWISYSILIFSVQFLWSLGKIYLIFYSNINIKYTFLVIFPSFSFPHLFFYVLCNLFVVNLFRCSLLLSFFIPLLSSPISSG